jgi:hypothetical protein
MKNYGELSPHTAAFAAKEMLRILAASPLGKAFEQAADPVDPELRARQEEIRKAVESHGVVDGRWQPLVADRILSLQAECALIGHRVGDSRCVFCGVLDRP